MALVRREEKGAFSKKMKMKLNSGSPLSSYLNSQLLFRQWSQEKFFLGNCV